MRNKIEWNILDGDGKIVTYCDTRDYARQCMFEYKRQIFDPWMDGIKWPLKIVRREYQLIDEKVVR